MGIVMVNFARLPEHPELHHFCFQGSLLRGQNPIPRAVLQEG